MQKLGKFHLQTIFAISSGWNMGNYSCIYVSNRHLVFFSGLSAPQSSINHYELFDTGRQAADSG